jgi:uncharacterized damage-inducible protein DinB
MSPQMQQLLSAIDEAYNQRSWHGANLCESINRLTAAKADWRARPGGPRIVDLVVHCAYWKYTVWRKLTGAKRGSFPMKGSDWFKLPEPLTASDWKQCRELLADQHAQLREQVAKVKPKQLSQIPEGSKSSLGMQIRGVAAHDVYHAGQIQLIKAVNRRARN